MTFDTSSTPTLLFTPITLPQKELIETIRKNSGNLQYVYTFASLFVWKEVERYGIFVSEDAFLIKHGVRGENVFMFPCGTESGKKKLIDALIKERAPVFSHVSDEDKSFLENAYPDMFGFTACRDDYPYLYDKDEQIALPGKEFKSLRHQINIGRASADEWKCEPLSGENLERALNVNRKWADARTDGDLADAAVAEKALRSFSDLGLWGRLFTADGKDVAYAAGVFVTPEIFDVSFCKVLDKQCDCFIKWALYRELPPEVRTVDSEEDMGLEGLRTHKLLRRPKELLRIWKGTPR